MNCEPKKAGAECASPHTLDAVQPEPFVTANEVAEHLKITRRQVLEMARKNQLPAHPISFGRQRKIWRFKLTEVDQLIASGTPKPPNAVSQHGNATSNTIIGGSPRSQKRKL
jgi:excisionase family DNA binding protein